MSIWANPEKTGVIIMRGRIPFYTDSGPDYDAAVAQGPDPYAGPLVVEIPMAEQAEAQTRERATLRASRLQFMAAMHNAGLLTAAEIKMAAAPFLTQLVWKEAADFRRNSPVIASLGLTAAALDDLFRAAAVLEF